MTTRLSTRSAMHRGTVHGEARGKESRTGWQLSPQGGLPQVGGAARSDFILGDESLALVGVPDFHRSVIAGAGEAPAVGAEGHPATRALDGAELLPRFHIPHFQRPVLAGAGQAPAVGAEGHTVDLAVVSFEGEDRLL